MANKLWEFNSHAKYLTFWEVTKINVLKCLETILISLKLILAIFLSEKQQNILQNIEPPWRGVWKKALSDFWCNVKFSKSFTTEYKEIWKENLVIYQKSLKAFLQVPLHLEQHYFFEDWFFMMILEEIFGQRVKLLMSSMKQAPVKTLENNTIMDKASSLQLVSQLLIS